MTTISLHIVFLISGGLDMSVCDLARKCKDGKWSIWSFTNGIQQLPKTLAENLNKTGEVELLLNTKCTNIKQNSDKSIEVHIH